jgi:hypothetical protein
MKLRSDSWAAAFSEEQIEQAYAIAIKANPRHACIPQLSDTFNCAAPSKTAFYRWLGVVEKESWRWRLKHAVSVAKTMEAALPDDADAIYRNSLVALGVDAAVQADPKIAIAIGKTLKALNTDREARLLAQIEQLVAEEAAVRSAGFAALDAPRRRIVVAPRTALPRQDVVAGEANWLLPPPAAPIRIEVKLRAREAPRGAEARWDAAAGLLHLVLDEPNVVAPGQACVLYAGPRVLAGGFIRPAQARDRDA